MASWSQLNDEAPEFGARVRAVLDLHKHKVMATLRADGAPRVSGTEVDNTAGELWLGSMTGAAKVRDLQRDRRVAIHTAPADHTMAVPDVKLDALAVEITEPAEFDAYLASRASDGTPPPPPEPFHLFRLDLRSVTMTGLGPGDPPDHLVIETWTPGNGVRRVERR